MFLFSGFRKPKNKFSLEHLKYLHQLLVKNPVITEGNKNLIVETLRQIAELMIWGDQHEENFFDFFLEKNILSYFLKILGQKTNKSIKVQIIQTLSILVENLRSETALYYILSNNHINDLITHKFDFSDEEVLAYYISFLKTLSLKLNKQTLQFFFNEQQNDFPLYTEALKFFNHPEPMIRTSVRTLTLNIYKVEDEAMRRFILDRSVPYFSNLVWFISDQCRTLDQLVINSTHADRRRLENFVAELLDLFYYIHDIFNLNIPSLSKVLCEHVLQYLMIPLFVASLTPGITTVEGSVATELIEERISPLLALFLLAQVFTIFTHKPLINTLAAALVHPQPLQYLPASANSGGPMSTSTLSASAGLAQCPTMEATMMRYLAGGEGEAPSSSDSSLRNEHAAASGDDTAMPKSPSTNDMQSVATATAAPPRHTRQPSGTPSSPVRKALFKTRLANGKQPKGNRFREALQNYLADDDRTVLGVATVLYAMLKNPSTDLKLLETSGLFPYRHTKARLILAALVSSDIALTDVLPSPTPTPPTAASAIATDRGHRRMRSRDLGLVEVDLTATTVPIPPPEQPLRRPPSSTALPLAFPESDGKDAAGPLAGDDKSTPPPPQAAMATPQPPGDETAKRNTANTTQSVASAIPRSVSRSTPVVNLFPPTGGAEGTAVTASGAGALDFHSGSHVWIERLLRVLAKSQSYRLVTLQVATLLLKELVYSQDAPPNLTASHMALLEQAYDNAASVAKERIAGHLGEIFLELFETELATHKQLHFESLVTDASLLLPLSETPMSGLALPNRLPNGELERTQKAIDALLVLRELKYTLLKRKDEKLPLKEPPPPKLRPDDPYTILGTKYVICEMVAPTNKKVRLPRVIVLEQQTMLVLEITQYGHPETPETALTGVVRDIIPLQSIEIEPASDNETPAALRLTSHPMTWSATLVFSDAAKCAEAKEWLERARNDWRNMKMKQILDLLNEHEEDCTTLAVPSTPHSKPQAISSTPPLTQDTPAPADREATSPIVTNARNGTGGADSAQQQPNAALPPEITTQPQQQDGDKVDEKPSAANGGPVGSERVETATLT